MIKTILPSNVMYSTRFFSVFLEINLIDYKSMVTFVRMSLDGKGFIRRRFKKILLHLVEEGHMK